VAFLAFFPTSIFLQAVYTESLFLVTTLATVLLARRGRWALAGVAGLLAALTRNTGVLLLIPFLAFYGASINWHWRAIDRRALWAVLIPVGTAIYMAYQWALGGNPLLFNDVQSEVWRRHLANPIDSLFRGANYSLILLHNLLWHGTLPPAAIHNLVAFPILAIAIMALALAWRRLRISYLVYAAAAIVIPLSFPSPQKPLYSMARFLLACFPLFIALGVLLERRPRVRWAMLAIFIAGYAWLTIEFTRHVFIS
jgi:Gpi18-like mannosyltransferase